MKFSWIVLLVVILSTSQECHCLDTLEDYHVVRRATINEKISNVAVGKTPESVFIGATNKIYRLTENLDVADSAVTGPNNDTDCPPEICKEAKYDISDNHNKILIVDSNKNWVISCGSGHGGRCEALNKDNLSHLLHQSSDSQDDNTVFNQLVCIKEDCASLGLVTQGFTVGNPVLYIASSQDLSNKNNKAVHDTLAYYSLNYNKTHENKPFGYGIVVENIVSALGHKKRKSEPGIIGGEFKYLFENGNFTTGHIYYAFSDKYIQKGKGYRNSLARTCKRDTMFFSYVETEIKCSNGQGTTSEELVGLYYVPVGDNYGNLYAIFQDEGSHLCVFDTRDLDEVFRETLDSCWKRSGNDENETTIAKLIAESKIRDCHQKTEPDLSPSYPWYTQTYKMKYYPDFSTRIPGQCGSDVAPSKIRRVSNFPQGKLVFTKTGTNFTSFIVDGEKQVAFIGTTNRSIIKVNLKNSQEYGAIDVGAVVNGSFIWKPSNKDGVHPQMFYTHTNDTIFSVRTSSCGMYSDCSSCFSSGDIYCGWCVLEGRCSTKEECSPENKWLMPSKDSCLSNSNQLIFQKNMHTSRIKLKVLDLPDLTNNETYSCQYDLNNGAVEVPKPAYFTDNKFELECDMLQQSKVPAPTGNSDFVNVTLNIIYGSSDKDNKVLVLTTHVVLYDCEQYSKKVNDRPCWSCLTSRWNCSWCVKHHQCKSSLQIGNGSADDDDRDCTWISNSQTAQCPRVVQPKTPYDLIPTRYGVPITVSVANLPTFQSSQGLTCHLKLDEAHKYNTRASIIKATGTEEGITAVECAVNTYTYDEESTELSAKLRLTWDDGFTVDSDYNDFTFYKCRVDRNDCSKCLSADPRYHCGWCVKDKDRDSESKCMIEQLCNTSYTFVSKSSECPTHQVDGFSPSSGPLEGGTLLEIYGKNMGASFEEVTEVTVAGVICQPDSSKFVTSTTIVCRTGAVAQESSGPIIVTVRDQMKQSEGHFYYKSPNVTGITPIFGPRSGGTVLTVRGNNLSIGKDKKISIEYDTEESIDCNQFQIINDTMIKCVTGQAKEAKNELTVNLIIDGNQYKLTKHFSYKPNPSVSKVTTLSNTNDLYSYIAGGRELRIYGESFTAVQRPILKVHLISESVVVLDKKDQRNKRTRRTRRSLSSRKHHRRSISRRSQFASEPGFFVDTELVAECNRVNDSLLICETPAVVRNTSINPNETRRIGQLQANLNLTMDGVVIPLHQLTYLANPSFSVNKTELTKLDYLQIDFENLWTGLAVTQDEIDVRIGTERCKVQNIQSQDHLLCEIPEQPGEGLVFPLTVKIGYKSWELPSVTYRGKEANYNMTVIIICVVVTIIVVIFFIWCLKSKQKRYKANKDDYKNAIENLEQSVRADFRKAFAELSIEMSDLTSDVIDTGIPCLDYRTYVTNLFFPSLRDHTCMRKPSEQTEADIEGSRAHNQFLELIMNPTFLHVFVRTLEEQRQSLTNRDKAHVASLLTVALHQDLKYFTKTVKDLVKDLIVRNLEKNPKLIFRRNDSIADRCLSNWLYITLYPALKEKVGKMIFMLLKAIKQQVSKGPLDAVSGKARYTLSDDRLLKEDIPYHNLTLFVKTGQQEEGGDDDASIVKVLSCDSVAQVKEKVMDVVYKRLPFSQRPRADQLDLEWHNGRGGLLVLPIDNMLSEPSSRWSRLYTVSDYMVENNATLALVPKNPDHQSSSDIQDTSAAPSVHSVDTTNALTPMLDEPSTRLYHLVKSTDESEQNRQSSINRDRHKYIPDLYLLRLLNMKGILQNYVQAVITNIFDENAVPLPVRYLYSFLDQIAAEHEINDPNILHLWKTNSLPCRFWVTILKNPEFVFDIEKPDTIGSSMTVITQTFIDACAVVEQRPTKDSPINKQLYAKEIPAYMKMVQDYYKKIKEDPAPHEVEVQAYIDDIQKETACEFDTNTALQELWPYVNKYYDEIMEKMDDDDPFVDMQMSTAKQLLMQTYNLMEHGSNTESS